MSTIEQSKVILNHLIEITMKIIHLPDCPEPSKRQCRDLIRCVTLLCSLFEEWKENDASLDKMKINSLISLKDALEPVELLLRGIIEGSKLYQVIKWESIMGMFHVVTEQLEKALSGVVNEIVEISDEVREQVELVHMQLKRAQVAVEAPDLQLFMDLCLARFGREADNATLKRLSKKLQLANIDDINKELLALHESAQSCDELESCFEEMSRLLEDLRDFLSSENGVDCTLENENILLKHWSPLIPDDFRCPISHELMKDPVIVSTGQTYERSYIQKWLDAGHKTCPKTQHTLSHSFLTPNYALKSLITQWCESNGKSQDVGSGNLGCDVNAIEILNKKLMNGTLDEQRIAAGLIRLLAKRNAENRICIAEVGVIPSLIEQLMSSDPRTQEHAVTALLNLSINENNKNIIVNAGAIPDIVGVLNRGSTEARENAAATLFSLSVLDESKMAIGAAGAIPPLIDLLSRGSQRGKRDAATAIFSLALHQSNKVRALRAGIMAPLMNLLMGSSGGMVDEALAILAILTCHPEGKSAVNPYSPVPILFKLLREGSPRNQENAVAVLCTLCLADLQQLLAAKEIGAEDILMQLAESGTDRTKRKAGSLLVHLKGLDGSGSPM